MWRKGSNNHELEKSISDQMCESEIESLSELPPQSIARVLSRFIKNKQSNPTYVQNFII